MNVRVWKNVGRLSLLGMLIGLGGCVYTTATLAPADASNEVMTRAAKNPGSILVTESDLRDRSFRVIGKVSATAQSINLVSSNPTRDDVNEALRAEASKVGADAVIGVRYSTEAAGLASRGKMIGEGRAVIFD